MFRAVSGCLGALCLWALTTAPAQAAGEWQNIQSGANRRDAVQAWVREVDGSPVKEFRGQTEAHYSVLSTLALITDPRQMCAWIFQCASATQPSDRPADHVYLRFKGAWPTADRDLLARARIRQDSDGSIVVDSREVSDYPVQAGVIRIPHLRNQFRLTPLKGGWTRIEFRTRVDLGGQVPAWLANFVSTQAPIATLEAIHRQLAKQPQSERSLAGLPAYLGSEVTIPPWHINMYQ
ncbi:MAG: START domain-containing protein [Aquabacterium sp.]|uniref:START domain-containing protein n=1 Tax=Aquabacterium sp. TaxID=1872578 RepID=UPI003BC38D6A